MKQDPKDIAHEAFNDLLRGYIDLLESLERGWRYACEMAEKREQEEEEGEKS